MHAPPTMIAEPEAHLDSSIIAVYLVELVNLDARGADSRARFGSAVRDHRAGVRPAGARARPTVARTLVPLARDDVLRVLRAHAPELARRYGVRALALFGSVARDLDMLDALEQLLSARVDVVSLPKLSPRLREYVERDLIRVA